MYPCPRPGFGYCPRKIVDYGNGEFAAICRDPYQICESVKLTQRDVLLHELDVKGLVRLLAAPLGIRFQDPVPRGDGTWGIGISNRRDTRTQPVFLVLLPDAGRFQVVLHRLLVQVSGPFVVIAPTDRHRTVEVQEMLQDRGVCFLALEEHIQIDDAGRIVAVDPQEPAGGMRPTPRKIGPASSKSSLTVTTAR